MTKARQKGVQKVNEMKIKARMKNVEERLKIFAKSPTETLRKRLDLDFPHRTNFFH